MAETYLTVEALTKYIKRKFDVDPYLRKVFVKGEVSNVKHHSSGHLYFTLKDDYAQIRGIMYACHAQHMKFRVEEGMNVLVQGDVNVFEKSGSYQFYASSMEPDGVGSLYLAFEQLKEALEKEGLFQQRFKQPIPKYPKTIGVITATTGAAIRDIITTLKRHYPIAKIFIFPTLVQGENAAKSIADSIRQANILGGIDTLIVGRGGGSIEDLWAFNEEVVARAIFESRIPIISAVGHETDTTIADFVADLRAPTPTGAAKLAVPDIIDLQQRLQMVETRLFQAARTIVQRNAQRLERVSKSYPMLYPERIYRPFEEQLLRTEERLQLAYERNITKRVTGLAEIENRLTKQNPTNRVANEKSALQFLEQKLAQQITYTIAHKKQSFQTILRTLNVLNPLSVMERGYSIVYNEKDEVIHKKELLKKDDVVLIQLSDGQVEAKVTNMNPRG